MDFFPFSWARGFLARWRHNGLRSALYYLRVIAGNAWVQCRNRHARTARAECPCCGWTGYGFLALDGVKFYMPGVLCPRCGAGERHRVLHLYLHRHHPDVFTMRGRVLHFAAESYVRRIIEQNPRLTYIRADLDPRAFNPRLVTDIRRVALRDDSVDLVFCIHVLEHVREDRQAAAELLRVLKPGGTAYIMVPFYMPLRESVLAPEPDPDLCDHIWAYALPDFKDRLDGFAYAEIRPDSFLTEADRRRFGIPDKEVIYRCTKSGDC